MLVYGITSRRSTLAIAYSVKRDIRESQPTSPLVRRCALGYFRLLLWRMGEYAVTVVTATMMRPRAEKFDGVTKAKLCAISTTPRVEYVRHGSRSEFPFVFYGLNELGDNMFKS